MNLKDRIFKSSVYGIASHIIRSGIVFALTPFLMRSLGTDDYGLWLLIVATVGWFRLTDFGFSTAVQRSIAIALEANDKLRINTVFSCSVLLFGILALIAAATLITLGYFPQALGIESQHSNTVRIAFLAFSVKVIWDLGMCSFHGFYSGLIRYDIDANIDLANDIVRAILIVALVAKLNIFGVIIATMVSDFITNVVKIYYAKKLVPGFKFDHKLISWKEFKLLYNYSKHVAAMSVVEGLSVSLDTVIISHLLGLVFVAIFGVAARLVGFVETAFSVVLDTFLPVFTRLLERKDDIRNELEEVFSLNIFLVSIFFVPLIIFSDDFIYLWLGEGFSDTHIIVVAVSIAAICRAISRPVSQVLLAKADHQYLSIVKLLGVFINLVLSITLARQFGFLGIALGTIISSYVSNVIFHLALYKYYTQYPIKKLYINFISSNILILSISFLGFNYLQEVEQLSWIELFGYSGLVFTATTALFWMVSLTQGAKSNITRVVRSRIPPNWPGAYK